MVCKSCVDKLARRLMAHKGVDMIRAYELASKGLERVEKRSGSGLNGKVGKSFDPDYSQACNSAGSCQCISLGYPFCCNVPADCEFDQCSYACPDPLPNSSLVGNDCVPGHTADCNCFADPTCQVDTGMFGACLGGPCSCTVSGLCYYSCNPGFVWNGVACVPVVAVGYQYGDGLVTVQT